MQLFSFLHLVVRHYRRYFSLSSQVHNLRRLRVYNIALMHGQRPRVLDSGKEYLEHFLFSDGVWDTFGGSWKGIGGYYGSGS